MACHSEPTGRAETGPNGKISSPPCLHHGQRQVAPPSPGQTPAPTAPAAVCMSITADRQSTSDTTAPTAEFPSQTKSADGNRWGAGDDTCTGPGAEPFCTKPEQQCRKRRPHSHSHTRTPRWQRPPAHPPIHRTTATPWESRHASPPSPYEQPRVDARRALQWDSKPKLQSTGPREWLGCKPARQ